MKRANQLFSEKDRNLIASAIERAERATSAEIVPVVASASGRYDRAEDIFGFLMGLVVVTIGWLTCPYVHAQSDWGQGMFLSTTGLVPVLVCLVVGFVAGSAMASYFPALRLPFIPAKEMEMEVRRAAEAAFMSARIRKTASATGLLLYVSLYEHRVIVLPDDGITAQVPVEDWQKICDDLVAGMKNQRPVPALEEAITRCGEILNGPFPRQDGDVEELTNTLHLID